MLRRCGRFWLCQLPRICAALALASLPLRLLALDPHIPLTDYQRKSWTVQDGYSLGEVLALAQTPDGFLWVGTSRGLRRFDGVNFTRVNGQAGGPLDDVRVTALCVSRDGALWVGTVNGLSRLALGQVKTFTTADGLPPGAIFSLLEDHKGVLWVGTGGREGAGLASITGNSIRRYGEADGLPNDSIYSLFEDRRQNLWIGFAREGACSWRPRTKKICPVAPPAEIRGIAEDPAGGMVFNNMQNVLRTHGGRTLVLNRKAIRQRLSNVLVDEDGNLWVGTSGSGLLRYRDDRFEPLTEKEGLPSNFLRAIFEDHDGNLWIGTFRGLVRLRNPVATHLTVPGSNLPAAVLAADDHRIWVASFGSGIRIFDGVSFSPALIPSESVFSLHQTDNALLAGTGKGLLRLAAGKQREIDGKDGEPLLDIVDIEDDGRGSLWFLTNSGQIFHMKGNDPPLMQPTANRRASAIYARDGTVWAGFTDGTVRNIRGASAQTDPLGDRWRTGSIHGITGDHSGAVWVGAAGGLGRYRNGKWTVWGAAEGIPSGGIFNLCAGESGLWAIARTRLIYIPKWSLDASQDGAPQPLLIAGFGADDGVELPDAPGGSNPRMALMPDGRLIVASFLSGLTILDTNRVHLRRGGIRSLIDQFLVDGQPIPLSPEPRIRGRQFQFSFTAPNISSGVDSRIYYHLDGVDPDWIEAREDRRAVYGLLRPGEYRFRVRAAGATNTASLTFRIPPRFYETVYFPFLILGTLALAGWGVYLLRVRQIRRGMQLIFQERLRVTREMHDSLLQGFTGVLFQLDTVARNFDRAPDDCRTRLTSAVEQAERSMKEARHAISLLRLPALENQMLSDALADMGTQVTRGMGPHFSSHIDAGANALPYTVQASLYVIARELVSNAATHARASRIDLRLECPEKSFRLIVEDNGQGFQPAQIRPATGHIGLAAVKERASLIGAQVVIDGKPGNGVRCEVFGRVTGK
ncbi:MAG TPA: two-component regulator propeller domain-containing protein [Bryobacteraceae bacterium]|nr:two-component regulator propeller domain-containing protein [Bryobacteraceae bacterium]